MLPAAWPNFYLFYLFYVFDWTEGEIGGVAWVRVNAPNGESWHLWLRLKLKLKARSG